MTSLDIKLKHEQTKRKDVLINLEAIISKGKTPSTVSIHHVDTTYLKRYDQDGEPYYLPQKERTIVYEFDYKTKDLNQISEYKGNFRRKGFRWSERLLRKSSSKNIEYEEAMDTYELLDRILEQLEENYHNSKSVKKKDEYEFFIKIIKRIVVV